MYVNTSQPKMLFGNENPVKKGKCLYFNLKYFRTEN